MGDMSDMFLDEVIDMEDLRFEYLIGGFEDCKIYDLGILNEHEFVQ